MDDLVALLSQDLQHAVVAKEVTYRTHSTCSCVYRNVNSLVLMTLLFKRDRRRLSSFRFRPCTLFTDVNYPQNAPPHITTMRVNVQIQLTPVTMVTSGACLLLFETLLCFSPHWQISHASAKDPLNPLFSCLSTGGMFFLIKGPTVAAGGWERETSSCRTSEIPGPLFCDDSTLLAIDLPSPLSPPPPSA